MDLVCNYYVFIPKSIIQFDYAYGIEETMLRQSAILSLSLGSNARILSHGTVGILGWRILSAGVLNIFLRLFSSIPELYPFDAGSPPARIMTKCFQTLPSVPWKVKSFPVENHCSNVWIKNFKKKKKKREEKHTEMVNKCYYRR